MISRFGYFYYLRSLRYLRSLCYLRNLNFNDPFEGDSILPKTWEVHDWYHMQQAYSVYDWWKSYQLFSAFCSLDILYGI